MPIPVDKLQETPPALRDQIVAFLSDNETNAYHLTEIIAGVEAYKREDPTERDDQFARDLLQMFLDILPESEREKVASHYRAALDPLVECDVVQQREHDGTLYYHLAPGAKR